MAPSEAPPQEHPLPPRIPLVHNAALAGTILIPFVMLLPPRKMDLRFFILAGTFSIATNQLSYEYTGQSLYARFGSRISGTFDMGMPEEAQKTQRLIREHRQREAAAKAAAAQKSESGTRQGDGDNADNGLRATVRNVWMGSEEEGWKERRMEEHRRAMEDGRGLSGIIMDQISEVWSGKDKTEPSRTDDNDSDMNTNDAKRSK